MKKILSIAVLITATLHSLAQDASVKDLQATANKAVKSLDKDGWKKGGALLLNINQGTLSNWAAGGEQNTLGINALINYAINYKKGKSVWDTYLNFALGFQNATSFNRARKMNDIIDLTTKYGYKIAKKWYASTLVNFNTQSFEGYNYTDTGDTKISNFLTPGKILLSLGVEYRPNTEFSVFISPITTRWILKHDNMFYAEDKFGVPAFKKSQNEFGAYITALYNKKLTSWATYTGRLDLFSNYVRKPQNVDLLCTNLLTMKFNKWLGTNISLDMIYDDDIIQKLQLKEILGVGITLKL